MKVIKLTWWGGGACYVNATDITPGTVHRHPEGGTRVVGRYGSVRVLESRQLVLSRLREVA